MPWSRAEDYTYMEQNKPNSVPEALYYSAPSIHIITIRTRQAILQGSGQGTGETDPYEEGGED